MPLNLTAPGDPPQVAWTSHARMALHTTGATAEPPPIYWNRSRTFAPTAITAARAYSPPPPAPNGGPTRL